MSVKSPYSSSPAVSEVSRPFWRQKLDLFRDGVLPENPLVRHFDPPRDPVPLTVTLRLPTMAERVAEFTRLGRPAGFYDDDLSDDDFRDYEDDIPFEGLSPHEDHPIKEAAARSRAGRQTAARKKAEPSNSVPSIEGVSPPGEGIPAAGTAASKTSSQED